MARSAQLCARTCSALMSLAETVTPLFSCFTRSELTGMFSMLLIVPVEVNWRRSEVVFRSAFSFVESVKSSDRAALRRLAAALRPRFRATVEAEIPRDKSRLVNDEFTGPRLKYDLFQPVAFS